MVLEQQKLCHEKSTGVPGKSGVSGVSGVPGGTCVLGDPGDASEPCVNLNLLDNLGQFLANASSHLSIDTIPLG